MEGLIPFLIHAIKKSRGQAGYRILSEGSTGRGSSRRPLVELPQEGSSQHRRTRSEFPSATFSPDYLSAYSDQPRFAPSRSLRENGAAMDSRIRRG